MRVKALLAALAFSLALSAQAYAYQLVDRNGRIYVFTDDGTYVGSVSKDNWKGLKKLIRKARKLERKAGK